MEHPFHAETNSSNRNFMKFNNEFFVVLNIACWCSVSDFGHEKQNIQFYLLTQNEPNKLKAIQKNYSKRSAF